MLARFIERIVGWLVTRRLVRSRTIWSCGDASIPLLHRYTLVNTRWFAIYAHHLCISDEDRALHDHPWSFVTCLLTSGYYEHTTEGRFWRRRFSVLWRPAEWSHRHSKWVVWAIHYVEHVVPLVAEVRRLQAMHKRVRELEALIFKHSEATETLDIFPCPHCGESVDRQYSHDSNCPWYIAYCNHLDNTPEDEIVAARKRFEREFGL